MWVTNRNLEETMMDKKIQKIGVICSIVQIILSIIYLIYNAINQENIIIWILFLCSGILLLSSNINKNNKKEDEWGKYNFKFVEFKNLSWNEKVECIVNTLTYGQFIRILFNKFHNNYYFELLWNLFCRLFSFYSI